MSSGFVRLLVSIVIVSAATLGGGRLYLNNSLRADLLREVTKRLGPRVEPLLFFPTFDPRDRATPTLEIALTPVATGLTAPTDIAFLPAPHDAMVVAEQSGHLSLVDLDTGALARWLDVEVETQGATQGLLSVAIHPGFAKNGRLFLHYTQREGGKLQSVLSEYRVPNPASLLEETPFFVRHVLRADASPGGRGGGMRFGPDGMLYLGWGDAGARSEDQGPKPGPKTWHGSILRIDIDMDADPTAQQYRVPDDNPLRDRDDALPETFAFGIRDPWRFSWDDQGRMIVTDAGREDWDEVGYALPGDNLGWSTVEGYECLTTPECETEGLREPFLAYPHRQGGRALGGFVSAASSPAALQGLYVFGDYRSGELWAVALPKSELDPAPEPSRLGAWPMQPSSFGRDRLGQLYVADHLRGLIYRFDDKPG